MLNLKLKKLDKDSILEKIEEANKAAEQLIDGINGYYNWEVTNERKEALKMFFDEQGVTAVPIEWRDVKTHVANRDAQVTRLIRSLTENPVSK